MFEIELETATDIDAWSFVVDKGQVYSAWLNGIDNSIKTFKGGYPLEKELKGQQSLMWSRDAEGGLILVTPYEDVLTIQKNLQ